MTKGAVDGYPDITDRAQQLKPWPQDKMSEYGIEEEMEIPFWPDLEMRFHRLPKNYHFTKSG